VGRRLGGSTACLDAVGERGFVASVGAVQFTIYYLTIQIQADCSAHIASYSKVLGFFPGDKAART